MLKKLFYLGIGTIIAISVNGCVIQPGGLAASTRPITAEDNYVIVQKDVTGTSGCILLLGIELWPASGYRALQDAKSKNNCDGLINSQDNTLVIQLYVFPFYRQYEVSGDAYKLIQKTERVSD